MAIFAAECLHGGPKTRLEISYAVDTAGTSCVTEIGGPAGEAAVQVFMGLLGVRCGTGQFTVERLAGTTRALVPSTGTAS